MASKARQFLNEQSRALSERAQRLRRVPVEIARSTAIKSAGRIRSLKDPVRALSHSGVRLTAISQSTAQSLIELQAEIINSALSNAAAQLEQAAQTDSVMDLARNQADVLRETRARIVEDLNQAVAIFKDARGGIREVATQTHGNLTGRTKRTKSLAKKAVRKGKRVARKTVAHRK